MWRSWVTDKPNGEGALGPWNALREVLPATREGRCWFHKTAKILAALPESAHPPRRPCLAGLSQGECDDR